MTDTPSAASALAFRVLNEIGIISQLATTAFERAMPQGMTLAQFTVLNHFVRLGGLRRPTDLARAFQVTKATMTSTLQRLEGKGLVAIEADAADGRGRLVAITEAGRVLHADCIVRLQPKLAEMVAAVGVDALAGLVEPLTGLRATLDTMRD